MYDPMTRLPAVDASRPIIRSASLSDDAKGFSQKTCKPRVNPASTTGR